MTDELSTGNKKLLLVGWEGADWGTIHPLVDAGKMPHLAKLIEEGVCGNLAGLQPVVAPMLWASMATGKRPYKHGVLGYVEADPEGEGIRAVTSLSRKTKAVWNVLNQNELRSMVVGWGQSYPAEPLTQGAMVSDFYQRAPALVDTPWPIEAGTVFPERLERVLEKVRFHPGELDDEDVGPFLPGLKGMDEAELNAVSRDPRVGSLAKFIGELTCVHGAATALIQNEEWDFMAVQYEALEQFERAFRRYHPPRGKGIDERDYRVFHYCLEAGHVFLDAMLGVLVELAGPESTVVLSSVHGSYPEEAGRQAEARPEGILAARGPGLKADHLIQGAGVLDVAPTILHHFGLAVGADMDGSVLLDLYEAPGEIERIPSWDAVAGEDGCPAKDGVMEPIDSKALLDGLVAQGRIAAPAKDAAVAREEALRERNSNLAEAYMDGGFAWEAMTLLEGLYDRWPREHRFGMKLARCYEVLGRRAELRELVERISERLLDEGIVAGEALKALRLDDPEALKADVARFEMMGEAERREAMIERQELIARARPDLLSLRNMEARADFAERHYEDALEKLDEMDAEYGPRRNTLNLRGEVYLQMREWERAIAAFEAATGIDPKSPAPHLGLARAALGEKRFEAAAEHAIASVGLLFHQPKAHYLLGMAYYRAGDWENAERAFLISVRLAPLLAASYRMLSEIARFFKKDLIEAEKYRRFTREALKRQRELALEKAAEVREAGII